MMYIALVIYLECGAARVLFLILNIAGAGNQSALLCLSFPLYELHCSVTSFLKRPVEKGAGRVGVAEHCICGFSRFRGLD